MATTAVAESGKALPDWITFGVAFLLVGIIAEGLGKLNKTLGYAFVFVAVFGFAVTGGRTEKVTQFFEALGVTAGAPTGGNNG